MEERDATTFEVWEQLLFGVLFFALAVGISLRLFTQDGRIASLHSRVDLMDEMFLDGAKSPGGLSRSGSLSQGDGGALRVGWGSRWGRWRAEWRIIRDQVQWWRHSEAGAHWEQGLGLVAVFACCLYVGETYIYDGVRCPSGWRASMLSMTTPLEEMLECRSLSAAWKTAEVLVAITFTVDYFIQAVGADSVFHRVTSVSGLVDLVSILPVLTVMLPRHEPLRPAWGFVRLMRAARILRLRRLLKRALVETVQGRTVHLVFTILVIIFLTSASIHSLAVYFDNHISFVDSRSQERVFWFHDAFYFVVCTITTIGYGDVAPATAWSRMLTVVAIVVTFAVVPSQFQKLLAALELQTTPYNLRFEPSTRRSRSRGWSSHVVVTGHLDATNTKALLQELFHQDHFPRNKYLKAVLLCYREPSDSLKALVESPQLSSRVVCLKGSPLEASDLARAATAQAAGVFVMTDHRGHLPGTPGGGVSLDEANLLRTMSVRAHLQGPHVPVITQLLQRETTPVHTTVSTWDNPEPEAPAGSSLAIERIKQNILAKSCDCTGFSTLVSNLICSHSSSRAPFTDPGSTRSSLSSSSSSVWSLLPTSLAPHPAAPSRAALPWEREYYRGCTHEIYRVPLGPRLSGCSFSQAADYIYTLFGAMLIGVERDPGPSGQSPQQGHQAEVVLNPGPGSSIRPDTIGFLVCQNEIISQAISEWIRDARNVSLRPGEEEETAEGASERRELRIEAIRITSTGKVYHLRSDGLLIEASPDLASTSDKSHRSKNEHRSGIPRAKVVQKVGASPSDTQTDPQLSAEARSRKEPQKDPRVVTPPPLALTESNRVESLLRAAKDSIDDALRALPSHGESEEPTPEKTNESGTRQTQTRPQDSRSTSLDRDTMRDSQEASSPVASGSRVVHKHSSAALEQKLSRAMRDLKDAQASLKGITKDTHQSSSESGFGDPIATPLRGVSGRLDRSSHGGGPSPASQPTWDVTSSISGFNRARSERDDDEEMVGEGTIGHLRSNSWSEDRPWSGRGAIQGIRRIDSYEDGFEPNFWPSAEAAAGDFASREGHVLLCCRVNVAVQFAQTLCRFPFIQSAKDLVLVDSALGEADAVWASREVQGGGVQCVRAPASRGTLQLLRADRARAVLLLARPAEFSEGEVGHETSLVDARVLRLCTEACKSLFFARHPSKISSGESMERNSEEDGRDLSFASAPRGGWVPKHLLLELVYEANLRFTSWTGGVQGWGESEAGPQVLHGEGWGYFMSPSFASGMVFVSSVMDRLTCQAFYNGHLLQIIDAVSEARGPWTAREQGCLLLISVVNSTLSGATYAQLVSELLVRGGLVPLGLYRSVGVGEAPLPYVVTNPPGHTLLSPGDQVYVIAPPQIAILDH